MDPIQVQDCFRPKIVKICKSFFISGECEKIDDCEFSHMTSEEIDALEVHITCLPYFIATLKRRCYFFLQGRCRNNQDCRFLHGDPPRSEHSYQVSQIRPTRDLAEPPRDHALTSSSSSSSGASNEQEQSISPSRSMSLTVPHTRPYSAPTDAVSEVEPASEKKSYAKMVAENMDQNLQTMALCPFLVSKDMCPRFVQDGDCPYLHGDHCDICNCFALHPHNEELRKKHSQECLHNIEEDMERSFAEQRSADKKCGICYEIVKERIRERRFGILPNCNHCFCICCIRKWRKEKEFETEITRSCPECRVKSDFVCPSPYWVDDKAEKEKLIEEYKSSMATKDCKYYRNGQGQCPFGNKCFYLHANANGEKVDVGPPPMKGRRTVLWDFVEERDIGNLEELDLFFINSDDSEDDFVVQL